MKKRNLFCLRLLILSFLLALLPSTASASDSTPAPTTPSSPSPSDGATNVAISGTFSWSTSAGDGGSTLNYDLYLGTSSSMTLYKSGKSSKSCSYSGLNYGTKYYWKIIVYNGSGGHSASATWSFTTEATPNGSPTPTGDSMALIYQDPDGVTHEIPMTEVGSLVAVDDAYDFTVLSVTGSILVEKVLKVSFGPQGSTDMKLPTPSGNMLGRLVEGKLTLIGVTGEVGIYDTGGALKAQVIATGGETIINIGHLPTGVYMVRNGKQTFKFMKK